MILDDTDLDKQFSEDVEIDSKEEVRDAESVVDEKDNESEEIESDSGNHEDKDSESEDEDELVIEIPGESLPDDIEKRSAPSWVKETRKINRELKRQNRELAERLRSYEVSSHKREDIKVVAKPTLEDCDYDSDIFESKLTEWFDASRKAEQRKLELKKQEEDSEKEFQREVARYNEAKSKVKVSDFEDIEEIVTDKLSTTQQGIIVSGANNPAYLVYALGKSPKKLEELANIKNPVKFACEIARLETQLKISSRKAPPAERKLQTGAVGSTSSSATLERLEAEAERTGDRTRVIEYKRKLRELNNKR